MSPDLAIPGVLVNPTEVPRFHPRAAETAAKSFLARYEVANTRRSYQLSLNQWFAWCDEQGIDPLEAKRPHIELFLRELTITGRTAATANSKLNALAGFYRYAVIDEIITRNPMDHVERPKIDRVSKTKGLNRTEFGDVVRYLNEKGSLQDRALVLTLGYTGLRVSECLGIQVDDLGIYAGQRTVFIRRRKGGKSQTLTLAPEVGWILEQLVAGRTSGPVFTTRTGAPMDRKSAARVVARVVKRAGISKRITPHSLRHTFVTLALDAGVPERDIAIATGHADTRMIGYYDRARDDVRRTGISTSAVASWVGSAA